MHSGLSIYYSNPPTPHLSAGAGHVSSDGATKGWYSSFCLSWLSILVFQSREGRGDKGSLNKQGTRQPAPGCHSSRAPFLACFWGIRGEDGISEQKLGAILLDCSWPVGQTATQTLQGFMWSNKIPLEQDTKAFICLEVFSKNIVISLLKVVVFFFFVWKHIERKVKGQLKCLFYLNHSPRTQWFDFFSFLCPKEKLTKRKIISYICPFVILGREV